MGGKNWKVNMVTVEAGELVVCWKGQGKGAAESCFVLRPLPVAGEQSTGALLELERKPC